MSGAAEDKKKSAFDFDVNFEKVPKRREQYLAKKAAERGETLLAGIDTNEDGDDGDQTSAQNLVNVKGFGRFNLFTAAVSEAWVMSVVSVVWEFRAWAWVAVAKTNRNKRRRSSTEANA
jgi:hypothetical protein